MTFFWVYNASGAAWPPQFDFLSSTTWLKNLRGYGVIISIDYNYG